MAELIVPLDVTTASEALAVVDRLGPEADFYEVGQELYTRAGPRVVEELRSRNKRVFLDLKLHDIPGRVAGAVKAGVALEVEFLSVHTSGGATMLASAREAAGEDVGLLGVTVLTSMRPSDVEGAWGRSILSIRDEVVRLAELAGEAGLDGVVASAVEGSWIRRSLGEDFLLVTPGIRPAGADVTSERRFATPAEAVAAGSNYLVVGRPITQASDPAAALASLLTEIRAASEN